MKVMAKALVLVLLLTLTCSATYIAATAAVTFENDDEMATYNAQPGAQGGTALTSGNNELSEFENAPAMRMNNNVVIPKVALEPAAEIELTAEGEPAVEYTPPPNTGYISDNPQLVCAALLLGAALLIFRRDKSFCSLPA